MDNWFTSFGLLYTLKKEGILACGTVKIGRIPQVSTKLKTDRDLKNRGRGSFDYMTENNDNVSVTKWFDNKCVHVASSYKGVNPIENVKRWSASEKKYIDVHRPSIIKEYNTFMGVDDMLVQDNVQDKNWSQTLLFQNCVPSY